MDDCRWYYWLDFSWSRSRNNKSCNANRFQCRYAVCWWSNWIHLSIMNFTALDFDPFEGDFGTTSDRILRDKLVKARVKHGCFHCQGSIQPGTHYRYLVAIFEGDMHTYKWCETCCNAMVQQLDELNSCCDEESYPFERRMNLHTNVDSLIAEIWRRCARYHGWVGYPAQSHGFDSRFQRPIYGWDSLSVKQPPVCGV